MNTRKEGNVRVCYHYGRRAPQRQNRGQHGHIGLKCEGGDEDLRFGKQKVISYFQKFGVIEVNTKAKYKDTNESVLGEK